MLTEQEPIRKRGGSKSGRKITRMALTSLAGLLQEAGSVYRRMKVGKLPHDEGRSLVWVLSQMRAMLEAQALEQLAQRLEDLRSYAEERHGYTGNHRETRLPN